MTEKSIAVKLQVKPGRCFKVVNPPQDVEELFSDLPQGAHFPADGESADVVLFFVKTMDEVKSLFPMTTGIMKNEGIPWLAYPKKTSKIKSDLDRDTIWQFLHTVDWTGVAMISIDDTWSGFRMKKVG